MPRIGLSGVRYLGIDYGSKRIGLALSDPEGHMAFPHSSVPDLGGVLRVIAREGVGVAVIGMPVPFGGGESAQGQSVRAFAERLRAAVELPIEFENEALTTKIAEEHALPRGADASAAALILQSYLDRLNAKSKT